MKRLWVLLACWPSLVFAQQSSVHGGVFTPKGDLRMLIIYAGFGDEPGGKSPTWPDDAEHTSLPTYIDPNSGAAPELVLSSPEDRSRFPAGTFPNLTRFYHEMSLGKFRLYGDVLKDPETGRPVRINIDPSEPVPGREQPARHWGDCNYRVLLKMKERYPDFDWRPYDQRQNWPNYQQDNSQTGPDGKPDFVVIIYRFDRSWKQFPIASMPRWPGSGGGFSRLSGIPPGFDYNGYSFDGAGYTQGAGALEVFKLKKYMEHEIAHELYSCPHVMGANNTGGKRWWFPASGYGMMSSWAKINHTANAWERWVLGWIDLQTGPEGQASDVATSADLPEDGRFVLRDFVTTGDVVRIRIPHTTDHYLWIENHQKRSPYDETPWAGERLSRDGEVIPPMEKGLYLYVENVLGDRGKMTKRLVSDMNGVNGIRLLNAQGNFDYAHPDTAPAGNWDYMWGRVLFEFEREAPNPISGLNPYAAYPDDFPRNPEVPGGDGKISYSNTYNNGRNESHPIIRQRLGGASKLLYGHLGGVSKEARDLFGHRSNAFQPGDELGLSGIVPALNYPKYDVRKAALEPFLLNGLSVQVEAQRPNGDMVIRVRFDAHTLNTDQRWCGDLLLRPPTEAAVSYALDITEGTTLTLDRSGTPNRHTMNKSGAFVNPTRLKAVRGARIRVQKGARLLIEDGSTLTIGSGSTLELEKGAKVRLRNGSRLVLEEGAKVNGLPGARVKVKGRSELIDHRFNRRFRVN